jgi:hypothetical protein
MGTRLLVFKPRTSQDGRVRVYGCSPGCLLISLAVSLVLTLLVNGCIHVLG